MIFFFFQAEDGIRDHCVTGVQTCALPISEDPAADRAGKPRVEGGDHRDPDAPRGERCGQAERRGETAVHVHDVVAAGPEQRDRKSTRLNSSHTVISYAVFCLKKKKKKKARNEKRQTRK